MNTEHKMTSVDTEHPLAALRDSRSIAFACGEWYVVNTGRLMHKPKAKQPDPRQMELFDNEEGPVSE